MVWLIFEAKKIICILKRTIHLVHLNTGHYWDSQLAFVMSFRLKGANNKEYITW